VRHGGKRPGAGRKKGDKWAGLEAKEYRRMYRERVGPRFREVVDAQLANALGLSHLVVRGPDGKFVRVEQSDVLSRLAPGETRVEIWLRDPSQQAAQDILNRVMEKPKEQTLDVTLDGGVVLKWQQ
jgi:hypothetical protein